MANSQNSLKTAIKRGLRPLAARSAPRCQQLPPERWNLQPLADGGLALRGHRLVDLSALHGTPLHVLDAAKLDDNVAALGGLEVFGSYKTQPVPAVLARLHAAGAGAEVISEMELNLALRLGMPGSRIIYNGPAKSDASIRTAITENILLLNLNHREELARVVAIARELGRRVRLGIRVNVPSGWSMQFGTPIAGGEAEALFEEALKHPEVQVVGLHSHRGALFEAEGELQGFLGEVLAFADRLHARFGWSPEILDVGGSLAIPTVKMLSSRDIRLAQTFRVEIGGPEQASFGIADYARCVKQAVAAHYQAAGRAMPRTVVEIGRALTGNAQMLIAGVITTKDTGDDLQFAVLDTGINIASIMRVARHQIFPLNRFGEPATVTYRLAGPICQPGDVIQNAIRLPELKPGDTLAIMDSGAYFEPDSTVFSFPRPATVMIDGDAVRVVRRRETLDDVISRDQWLA